MARYKEEFSLQRCGLARSEQSKKSGHLIMSKPSDASFADLQKGRRKMLIHPNHSNSYRNWAYCCAAINRLNKEIELCLNGPIPAGAYGYIQANGKRAYIERRKKRIPALARKIAHYAKLRDKIAAKLDAPEKHLLQVEDILNMVGNVIEITPRHHKSTLAIRCVFGVGNVIEITPRHKKEKVYLALNKCSEQGSQVNGLDAYQLLALGYGK